MNRVVVLALALSAACATTSKPLWVDAAGPYRGGNYELTLPAGWMRANDQPNLVATRDGTPVQLVVMHRDLVDKPLEHTKRQARADMSPLELSEVLADEFATTPEMKGYEVLERGPATVAEGPGFRLVSTFKDTDGLSMRSLVYGRLQGGWFFWIVYQAPERYYFERNVASFEEVVRSFKLS